MSDASHALALPALADSVIGEEQVRALFNDVAACTRVLAVLVRTTGHARGAAPGELPLMAAMESLLAGSARSVQLRYLWDSGEWWDTVTAVEGGFRIVRIRHSGA